MFAVIDVSLAPILSIRDITPARGVFGKDGRYLDIKH
jgi:hypothetical protein